MVRIGSNRLTCRNRPIRKWPSYKQSRLEVNSNFSRPVASKGFSLYLSDYYMY